MRHCDDDTLAAYALGEPVGADDAAHLDACARCDAELAELRALQGALVDAGSGVPLVSPPPRVWDAIAAQVDADERSGARPEAVLSLDGARRRREPRHFFRPWVVGAAAAAGAVIGGVGVALLTLDAGPELTVVAQADLADLATEEAAGTARVERRGDGTEVLVVDTTYVPAQGGSLEVWLIDPNVEGMVSLGFLTSSHAVFDIPEGYDAEAFPIVDISVEPADGDPTHSGDSITRGVLGV